MTIDSKLLKLKDISPLQKLILGLIMNTHPVVLQLAGGYTNTCGEIAKELGSTRNRVRAEVDNLIERGYITCQVSLAYRVTNITQKLLDAMDK
ncbi:hypothetical protein [Aestuariibaculum sediminum]|uniref:Uncharacterized protein n=1 Tax=Aestuariibaculum sediminum TaxID=2770637 RepID=A0A8J6Q3J1_9FLAO|nr:hypothetical protein [Aestuariibaculum sediminum]MBD0833764.1 hypothetical protein [Aestuariibaculum sediminum]